MRDYEAIKFYTSLIDKVEDIVPYPTTDEAWEERQKVHRFLLEERKRYVDWAYQIYLDKSRKPWCSECNYEAVWNESLGWIHVQDNQTIKNPKYNHEVDIEPYLAGCEAEIIKRLRGEI